MTLLTGVICFLIVFVSLSVHEFFHAAVAYSLGDDTAKLRGRLTLNPVKHIDRFGTILLPGVLFLVSSLLAVSLPVIGYAKPVPVNPSKLKIPRFSMVLVAMAGPLSNILLAILCVVLLSLIKPESSMIQLLFVAGFKINIFLAAFNALPIPPLDGGRLVQFFLPKHWVVAWEKMGILGVVVILFFIDGKWIMEWSNFVETWVLHKLSLYLN